jgi:hypothetical protein
VLSWETCWDAECIKASLSALPFSSAVNPIRLVIESVVGKPNSTEDTVIVSPLVAFPVATATSLEAAEYSRPRVDTFNVLLVLLPEAE